MFKFRNWPFCSARLVTAFNLFLFAKVVEKYTYPGSVEEMSIRQNNWQGRTGVVFASKLVYPNKKIYV